MVTYEDFLGSEIAGSARWRPQAPFALVRVHGPDAVEFLQRLCSQDVAGMAPLDCSPAAFLNAKGKLVSTCWVGRGEAECWITTDVAQVDALAENLDRYHFTENLAIERPAMTCAELIATELPGAFEPAAGTMRLEDGGVEFHVARRGGHWLRRFRVEAEDRPFAGVSDELSPSEADAYRILGGWAAVGTDTDETTLGLEADLDDHVSTDKGCYTGQEIVARIHTYGHVNRRLCTLVVATQDPIEVGTSLLEPEDGIAVGRVMGSAALPDGQRRVALGYLPQDFWAPSTELTLGAEGGPSVQVVVLGPEQASAT